MLGGCPYCPAGQGRRSSRTVGGRWVRECGGCGRVVEELGSASHDLFYLRAQDSPLCVVTPDLIFDFPSVSSSNHPSDLNDDDDGGGDDKNKNNDDDPFESPGFITAFSTWSLESVPTPSLSSFSFSGLLAQLERSLLLDSPSPSASSSSSALPTTPAFLVDGLRARLQIMEVGSLLKLDWDILDHSFQLFRDCSSVTCLRNRNVEALATAALLHAIREAQEPRTLQVLRSSFYLFLFYSCFFFYYYSYISEKTVFSCFINVNKWLQRESTYFSYFIFLFFFLTNASNCVRLCLVLDYFFLVFFFFLNVLLTDDRSTSTCPNFYFTEVS